ncbi:MAG: hypothetical protein AB7F43_04140 [Bacteriovoracia bacterium]
MYRILFLIFSFFAALNLSSASEIKDRHLDRLCRDLLLYSGEPLFLKHKLESLAQQAIRFSDEQSSKRLKSSSKRKLLRKILDAFEGSAPTRFDVAQAALYLAWHEKLFSKDVEFWGQQFTLQRNLIEQIKALGKKTERGIEVRGSDVVSIIKPVVEVELDIEPYIRRSKILFRDPGLYLGPEDQRAGSVVTSFIFSEAAERLNNDDAFGSELSLTDDEQFAFQKIWFEEFGNSKLDDAGLGYIELSAMPTTLGLIAALIREATKVEYLTKWDPRKVAEVVANDKTRPVEGLDDFEPVTNWDVQVITSKFFSSMNWKPGEAGFEELRSILFSYQVKPAHFLNTLVALLDAYATPKLYRILTDFQKDSLLPVYLAKFRALRFPQGETSDEMLQRFVLATKYGVPRARAEKLSGLNLNH